MGSFSPREQAQSNSRSSLNETLKQLILENNELRQTAANLVLQTAILRERLPGPPPAGLA